MDITVSPQRHADPDTNSVPTSDRAERILGLLVLLLGFGGFVAWAAIAPIDSAAVAPGVVTVEGSRKTIQHLDGGVVDQILVREGDHVEAGQLLLRLDDREASAQLEVVRGQLIALRAEEARLVAERDDLPSPEFPSDLLNRDDSDPRVQAAIIGQERVFETRRDSLDGEISVLNQRIAEQRERIQGLEGTLETHARRIALYQEEIDAYGSLFDRQLGDMARLREVERQQAELLGEQAEQRSAIAAARVKIDETKLEIAQVRRRFVTEVVTRLREVETELADLRERARALTARVERTEIHAPVSGAVVDLQMHTIGGVLQPGDKVLDIIPDSEPLLIEAQVRPDDIDKVYPGLEADVRFTAFNTSTTPTVEGQVLTISADRLTDPNSEQPYYLARIEVTPEGMEKLREFTLLPGMAATVMIKTGERTFFEYLIRPITDRLAIAFRED
ncbi:MAG: HlyD family type I secretion periplasmic adaptor subunit [Gammaproteobacteria bacterium]|jgi:epimerase transport system membrane fusion protein|nr:HlyD family type I secretion periplasmic adaptor subunit [Gammaproteobacteria bacterium]